MRSHSETPPAVSRVLCGGDRVTRIRDYIDNPEMVNRLSPAAARNLCLRLLAEIERMNNNQPKTK
jgi:hypothetical protein